MYYALTTFTIKKLRDGLKNIIIELSTLTYLRVVTIIEEKY